MHTKTNYVAVGMLLATLVNAFSQPAFEVDPTFKPSISSQDFLMPMAVQPDGKIIVACCALVGILRLEADGSLDSGFSRASLGGGGPISIAVQKDGKVIIAGEFTDVNGTGRNRVARLHPDGTLDVSFDPGSGVGGEIPRVESVAVQSNGAVIISGPFSVVGGVTRRGLARLNPNGTLDAGFTLDLGTDGAISALAIDRNDKILLGEIGASRAFVARLNSDGTLDASFNAGTGSDGVALALVVQDDGKIVIAGEFTQVGGAPRNGIARLNPDGTLDATFDLSAGVLDPNLIWALAVQDDHKVIIGGPNIRVSSLEQFTDAVALARFSADGSLDTEFLPIRTIGFDFFSDKGPSVRFVAQQNDRGIVFGGYFNLVNGELHPGIARLRPAPVFRGPTIASDGAFTARIGGQAGWTYRLEASSDLVDWQPLAEVPSAGAQTEIRDPGASVALRRFYRLVLK